MTSPDLEQLRFPIGPYTAPDPITAEQVATWIDEIDDFPSALRQAVEPLDRAQLDTPYRPGGWTVRQVVHHLGDSHLNSLIRFKWALTEDHPTIKAYYEDRWAELADYRHTPLDVSLGLLDNLHTRWAILLRSLGPEELQRTLLHPEIGEVVLDWYVGNYAWHGRHHLAHITELVKREGW